LADLGQFGSVFGRDHAAEIGWTTRWSLGGGRGSRSS